MWDKMQCLVGARREGQLVLLALMTQADVSDSDRRDFGTLNIINTLYLHYVVSR